MKRTDLLLMVCRQIDGTVNRKRFRELCNKWSPEARAASLAARIAKYGSGFSPSARAARASLGSAGGGLRSLPAETTSLVASQPARSAPGVLDVPGARGGFGRVGVEPYEDPWMNPSDPALRAARTRFSMVGFGQLRESDKQVLFKDALRRQAAGERPQGRDAEILGYFDAYNADKMAAVRVNTGDPVVLASAAFQARNKGVRPQSNVEWAAAERLAGLPEGTLASRNEPLGYKPRPYTTAATARARKKGYETFMYQERREPETAADWDRVDTLGGVPRDEWWDRSAHQGVRNRWSDEARAGSLMARMAKYGSGFSPEARAAAAAAAAKKMPGSAGNGDGQKAPPSNKPSYTMPPPPGTVIKKGQVIRPYDGNVYQYDHLGNLHLVGSANVIRPGAGGGWEIRQKGSGEWVAVPDGAPVGKDGQGRSVVAVRDGVNIDLATGERVPNVSGLVGPEVGTTSTDYYQRVGDSSAVRDAARLTWDPGHLNEVTPRGGGTDAPAVATVRDMGIQPQQGDFKQGDTFVSPTDGLLREFVNDPQKGGTPRVVGSSEFVRKAADGRSWEIRRKGGSSWVKLPPLWTFASNGSGANFAPLPGGGGRALNLMTGAITNLGVSGSLFAGNAGMPGTRMERRWR